MNWLLSEAIMNSWYHQRVISAHIRISKWVHKIGKYSKEHNFAWVYLKIKRIQLSKGALYRKMVQYGIKLTTKHPSETNNSFEILYLKSIIFGKKIIIFYNIPIKIFCCQNNIGMFLDQIDGQE